MTLIYAGLAVAAALLAVRMAVAGDREALWKIVHEKCVPQWTSAHDPAPCVEVNLAAGEASGVAILKDRRGKAQFLAMPTARITGIESPDLEGPAAPPLFAAAWEARRFMAEQLGGVMPPRDAVSLAINSAMNRSQDQAHIHIDCLSAAARTDLAAVAAGLGDSWSAEPVLIAGRPFLVRRIAAGSLASENPFELAAGRAKAAGLDLGQMTVVVAGSGSDSAPAGFLLLVGFADAAHGANAHGEDVQDHECQIVASDASNKN